MATANQTAPVGSWLKVSTALENVVITHKLSLPLHVYVGSVDPDANSAYHECRADTPFSMGGISGQNVYIRSGAGYAFPVVVTAV
jgi:hypothetical protein